MAWTHFKRVFNGRGKQLTSSKVSQLFWEMRKLEERLKVLIIVLKIFRNINVYSIIHLSVSVAVLNVTTLRRARSTFFYYFENHLCSFT